MLREDGAQGAPEGAPEEAHAAAGDAGFDDLLSPAEPTAPSRAAGWLRVFRGNRTLWVTAAIAVVSLVAGLVVGRFVVSPAEASAAPPEPGLITVPVEFGELSNDVTIRGQVGFVDAVEVSLDTSSLSGPAIVTGRVPETGAELGPLSIALEVAGRPVIVLPGDLPAYRTLRFGTSGPDVTQFKQAMASVGIDAGDPASDVFDEAAANAVTALYAQVGYAAPPAAEGTAEAVLAAEEGVRGAQQALAAAQDELSRAGSGVSAVTLREADNQVSSARRQLDAARAETPQNPLVIADLEDALALAQLRRDEVAAAPDTSGQRAAVAAARDQVTQANTMLARAREQALPFLPSSEILYFSSLPRRVDSVAVTRGTVLQGAAMTVSGATLRLTGSAAEADAKLLQVGGKAQFELPDGTPHGAVIAEVTPGEGSESRWAIVFEPDPLSVEQVQQLQGSNVRVSIPVGATEGEVLFVPLAALTAGPGGESRVEVVEGDPRDGDRARTTIVVVETGLAAGGFVEVRALEGSLEPGDLVVVGR